MKQKKILIGVLSVVLVVVCAVALLLEINTRKQKEESELANAGDERDTYSWEEYQTLSLEDQDAYFQMFDSVEAFEDWMESVKPVDGTEPELLWNKTGKNPDAFTWEEYQALDAREKDAFYSWFDSEAAFEKWLKTVSPTESVEPTEKWNKEGKKPDAYTWEEYQALSSKEQEAFYRWFDSLQAFEAWMESVKPEETTEPVEKWNKEGKKPDAYTWEEYQALCSKEQEAFYQWFDSLQAFEAWMESVKLEETTEPVEKWNKEGKKPDAYTWEEYQALSSKEQEAFYQWFDSLQAFEAWMESVKPEETTKPAEKWNKEGKKPDAYTWEEYQSLTPEEQDAFFSWFESVDAFEAWMEKVTDN